MCGATLPLVMQKKSRMYLTCAIVHMCVAAAQHNHLHSILLCESYIFILCLCYRFLPGPFVAQSFRYLFSSVHLSTFVGEFSFVVLANAKHLKVPHGRTKVNYCKGNVTIPPDEWWNTVAEICSNCQTNRCRENMQKRRKRNWIFYFVQQNTNVY